MSESSKQADDEPPKDTEGSYRELAMWYVVMLAIIFLSVVVAYTNIGGFTIIVLLALAAAKAIITVLYYMEIRYRDPLVWIFASAAVMWLILLFGLTLCDYLTRHWVLLEP